MSLTVSPGLVKARQWTAVAARLVEYLEAISKKKRPREAPKGSVYAAMKFFEDVGHAIEAPPLGGKPPAMVGISNLSIAVEVLTVSGDPTSETIASTAKTYQDLLKAILDDRMPEDSATLRELISFFRALEDNGNTEREAAIALGEQSLREPELVRRRR